MGSPPGPSIVPILLALCLLAPGRLSQDVRPVLVAELWRHGARSPTVNYQNESYVNFFGSGNLISNGLREHYVLGAMVREKYRALLGGSNFSSADVKCYSSDYDRTIKSAIAHLMGVYPAGTGFNTSGEGANNSKIFLPPFSGNLPPDLKFNDSFALPAGYNPVPIHVRDHASDSLFMKNEAATCPWSLKVQRAQYAARSRAYLPAVEKFGQTLAARGFDCGKIFGAHCVNQRGEKGQWDLNTTGLFGDMARCSYYYNGTAYPGLDEALFARLSDAFGLFYMLAKYPHPDLVRLYNTHLLGLLVGSFDEKVRALQQGSPAPGLKYLALSGHETNLVPLLMAFNLTSVECTYRRFLGDYSDPQCLESPAFAANLIFELGRRESSGQFLVRGLYNGLPFALCPGRGGPDFYCEYRVFRDEVVPGLVFDPEKYSEYCFGAKFGRTSVIIVVSLLLAVLAVAVVGGKLYQIGHNPEAHKEEMRSARMTQEIF